MSDLNLDVEITLKDGTQKKVAGVHSLSFCDNETHGPARIFGITEDSPNDRVLIVSSPNVAYVVVDQ